MSILRIAIVDEVEKNREKTRNMVEKCLKNWGIVAKFHLFSSSEELLEHYVPEDYALLLLDFCLDGMSGMELARRLRAQGDKTPLMFVSASSAYAVQSYQVDAENYLLKPLDQETVNRAMVHFLEKQGNCCKSITVTASREQLTLPHFQIFWIESQQNAVNIHLEQETVKVYMTFSKLMEQMGEDDCFLLCCRGCLVNMNHVDDVREDEFLLGNGETVPIRRRGGKQIRQCYIQHLCARMGGTAP